MIPRQDDAYDRLLDALDRGHMNRLTFIRRALALGIAAPAVGAALGQLPFTRGVDAQSQAVAAGTITYWTVPAASQKAFDQGEGAIIKLFEKAYPQVNVTVQQIPFADYSTKLGTAARAGSAPDVARVNHPDLESYAGAGWLAPLNAYINASKVITPKDYFPGFYAVTFYKGKQYALPTDTDNRALYYNKKLFKQAGLVDGTGNPRAPRTWAELIQASNQLKAKIKGVYPLAMAMHDGVYGASYQSFGNFMIVNGGYLLSQHGKARAQASRDPATVQAWNWFYGDLYTKAQAFAPGSNGLDEQALFARGVVAMIHDGPWARPEAINPSMQFGRDYAIAPTPVRTTSQHPAGTQGGWLMGMSSGSKNQAAAWAFIEFIQRPAINAFWCAGGGGGALPARNSVWKLKEFADNPVYAVYHAQLPYSRPPITPLVPQTSQISQELDNAASKAMLGQMDPLQALRSFDTQVNGMLG